MLGQVDEDQTAGPSAWTGCLVFVYLPLCRHIVFLREVIISRDVLARQELSQAKD